MTPSIRWASATGAGRQVGIATDLGYVTDSIRFHLRRPTAAARIESRPGHAQGGAVPLVGEAARDEPSGAPFERWACDFIMRDFASSAAALILGHLSEHNNHPEIARMGATQALERRGLETRLVIAEQKSTEVFTF